MKAIGFVLVAAAFLVGAYLSSLDERIVEWINFIPAILAGVVGVALVKVTDRRHAMSAETLTSNKADIDDSLARLVADLEKLDAEKESIPTADLHGEIDKRLRDDLTRFADARHSLAHIYGLQAYADVMSSFAAGERYVNRVWSASADGYGDEAKKYITRAFEQFQDARLRLDALRAEQAGTG